MPLPSENSCRPQHLAVRIAHTDSREIAERLPALILNYLDLGLPMVAVSLSLPDSVWQAGQKRLDLARHTAAALAAAVTEFDRRGLAICFGESLFTARRQSFRVVRRGAAIGSGWLLIDLIIGCDGRDKIMPAVAQSLATNIGSAPFSRALKRKAMHTMANPAGR